VELQAVTLNALEAERDTLRAEVEKLRSRINYHECDCDQADGHDDYCVNTLLDRADMAEAEVEALRAKVLTATAHWEAMAEALHLNIQRYAEPGSHAHWRPFIHCGHSYCREAREAIYALTETQKETQG